jgi:hypothetical protein
VFVLLLGVACVRLPVEIPVLAPVETVVATQPFETTSPTDVISTGVPSTDVISTGAERREKSHRTETTVISGSTGLVRFLPLVEMTEEVGNRSP